MRLRELFGADNERQEQTPAHAGGHDDNLTRLRMAGDEFLAAGAEAINKALSSNSQKFLEANRQQGGQ